MFYYKYKKLFNESEEKLNQTQRELEKSNLSLAELQEENKNLSTKYSGFIEKDKIIDERNRKIEILDNQFIQLNEKYQASLAIYQKLNDEIGLYEDSLEIGSYGLYKPQFNYDTPEKYKSALEYNYDKQKQLIKNDLAAICKTEWMVGGSKTEGRKMTNQYKKLMLFAFNGESDSCIAKVKWNNAAKTKERIEKAFESINKLGVTQNVHLSNEFLELKLEELFLTHEYELKVHAEKEEQRRIREQMREEEKAQKEFERAEKDAAEEERRFQKALDKAKQELGSATKEDLDLLNNQIKALEQKLQEAQEKKERAISLAQQTKVGHIYVISNIGSFGEHVYKIGLTRRFDPLDRVRELGDASVPFHFDVHAIIYSDNAPQLEYELHQKFESRRLNRMNNRKEFFKVTLDEIETCINEHTNAEIKFTKAAEAREFRETIAMLEKLNAKLNEQSKANEFPTSLMS